MAIDPKKYNWNANYNDNPNISNEERQANRSKAGKQKGINARRRKKFKEILDEMLSYTNSEGEGLDELISLAVIQRALDGDLQSITFIRDTLGEKPKDEVELSTKDSIEIIISAEEEEDNSESGETESGQETV